MLYLTKVHSYSLLPRQIFNCDCLVPHPAGGSRCDDRCYGKMAQLREHAAVQAALFNIGLEETETAEESTPVTASASDS